ncbi:uncharacterized protein LOC128197505 [Vigna angularis]|uniref:uncharacterized protein LOC128197505 n=1 Tax=Phaseolus angularis TaxID=3914 RepID=UPI0022B383EF|nr:uncharacterized protein LOC128197505 [Vigna angularis]
MYRNEQDAKNLRWHADERIRDGKLRHPADSPQWAKVDHDYLNFGKKPRNLRLSLSTDGINPHGPKQPGNDIDIYLAPLIEDLKDMWNEGVEVYDAYTEESFLLRAMLFDTINDFPAYGNLSGYSIKGKCACPICEDNTDWVRLEHGKKNVFLGHRRFLPSKHRYRGWRKAFNGTTEERRAPELLYGDKVFEKVKDINNKFGKPFARDLVTSTLLNVPGKSKDGINARLDLVQMGIRTELAPIKKVKETQYCGPAYMRWMYLMERYMKILKGYVKNRSRPEGCIVERYILEEAIEFCTDYLSNVESIGLPNSRHLARTIGEGISGNTIVTISRKDWEQAQLYILHNDDEVEPYVEKHKDMITKLNPTFIQWLKSHIFAELNVRSSLISDRLKWLANGPNFQVFSYTGYMINGCTFYTKDRDDQSTMQNSGVTLVAESMHISSAKDRSPIYANMSYFGVIEHIWELDYTTFRVPIFGCKWVDNNNGVRQDEIGFMQVNFNKVGYKDEPFILASQAQQIFYVIDPVDVNWSIVLLTNKINDPSNDDIEDEYTNIEDDPLYQISYDDDPIIDDILYRRDDHDEGIWINPSFYVHKKPKSLNFKSKKKRLDL